MTIVETGCVRERDSWSRDGQSTVLFDRYLSHSAPGSKGYSIDIDPRATGLSRELVGSRIEIRTGNSIPRLTELARELRRVNRTIDLLYLDSYDVDWRNVLPSAVHHLKELLSISRAIDGRTLVVVDDAPLECNLLPVQPDRYAFITAPAIGGKGKFIAEYAAEIGATNRFAEYQAGWTGLVDDGPHVGDSEVADPRGLVPARAARRRNAQARAAGVGLTPARRPKL